MAHDISFALLSMQYSIKGFKVPHHFWEGVAGKAGKLTFVNVFKFFLKYFNPQQRTGIQLVDLIKISLFDDFFYTVIQCRSTHSYPHPLLVTKTNLNCFLDCQDMSIYFTPVATHGHFASLLKKERVPVWSNKEKNCIIQPVLSKSSNVPTNHHTL